MTPTAFHQQFSLVSISKSSSEHVFLSCFAAPLVGCATPIIIMCYCWILLCSFLFLVWTLRGLNFEKWTLKWLLLWFANLNRGQKRNTMPKIATAAGGRQAATTGYHQPHYTCLLGRHKSSYFFCARVFALRFSIINPTPVSLFVYVRLCVCLPALSSMRLHDVHEVYLALFLAKLSWSLVRCLLVMVFQVDGSYLSIRLFMPLCLFTFSSMEVSCCLSIDLTEFLVFIFFQIVWTSTILANLSRAEIRNANYRTSSLRLTNLVESQLADGTCR